MAEDVIVTSLRWATEADFVAMLHDKSGGSFGLRIPPGGVDSPEVIAHVRTFARRLWKARRDGSWIVVCDGEAVGLCGYKSPPEDGVVEIGYSIAPSRWGFGHATRAVRLMLDEFTADPSISAVIAVTAADNLASMRVLEKNGFARTATRVDANADEGETIAWRRVQGEGATS